MILSMLDILLGLAALLLVGWMVTMIADRDR